MTQTVYVKYNNTRCPQFATRTEIVENGEERFVRKTALTSEGQAHIDAFSDKSAIVQKLYQNIHAVGVRLENNGAVFPFVTGMTAGSDVESALHDPGETIRRLKQYLRKIDTFQDDFTDFIPSNAFTEVFGEIDYDGPALPYANVDEILDNFLITDGGLTLIDYEWVFDFPVPIRYIQFRTIYYFYVKNHSILSQTMDEQTYLSRFNCPPDEVALWKRAEDHFQQYVHGKDRCFSYPAAYEKEIRDINYLLNHVPDIAYDYNQTFVKDEEIRALRESLHPTKYPKYLWEKLRSKI